jgi:hypothetical protein
MCSNVPPFMMKENCRSIGLFEIELQGLFGAVEIDRRYR